MIEGSRKPKSYGFGGIRIRIRNTAKKFLNKSDRYEFLWIAYFCFEIIRFFFIKHRFIILPGMRTGAAGPPTSHPGASQDPGGGGGGGRGGGGGGGRP